MAENRDLTEELKERLDIFFGEDDDDELEPAPPVEKSPLEGLRSVLLSLEWEITDQDLDLFLKELEAIKTEKEGNSIEILFIKLLESIGRYVKAKKANAHPNTIKLLNNAFQNFAQVVETNDISENEKKTLLLGTIKEFKEVKAAISHEKKGKVQNQEREPRDHAAGEDPAIEEKRVTKPQQPELLSFDMDHDMEKFQSMTPHEAFALALQEIKKTVEKEFEALRAEIRMWRNGQ
ncbi:MAG: hypothetical protein ACLFQR_01015 [Desulfovibrionales bacterium]